MQFARRVSDYVLPAGFSMCAPTLADANGIANVFNAESQLLVGRNSSSEDAVRAFLNSPTFDPAENARIIFDTTNNIVGFVGVWNHPPHVENRLTLRIWPEHRDSVLRPILLTWGEQHAASNIGLAPDHAKVTLKTWCFDNDTLGMKFYPKAGYARVRASHRMSIDLGQIIPEPQFPDGIKLNTAANFNDLYQIAQADDEAFQDHWGYVTQSIDKLVQNLKYWIESSENIDTNYWYLALDGDEIAGLALCAHYVIGQENVAHIHSLATRSKWRRQGIALGLLHHVFREMKELGRTHISLEVDASSLTGATDLYAKAGMQVIETDFAWEKTLRNGVDYRTQELED